MTCSKYKKNLCVIETCEICNLRRVPQYLIDEFDKNKNSNINILELSFSSHKKLWWLCKKGHSYQTTLNARTNKKNSTNCSICHYNNISKYSIEEKNQRILHGNSDKDKTTLMTGEETEKYIYELFLKEKQKNNIQNVQLIGNLGGYADMIVEFKDTKKCLQIKTLTYISKNKFYMTYDNKYKDNLLICMVDKNRKFFCVEFAKNITVKRLRLDFDYKFSKYNDIMMTNESDFINTIIKKLKNSIDFISIEEQLSETGKKEYKMIQNFKKFCIKNNLEYTTNNTNTNSIDGYINKIPVQLKYATFNQKNRKTIQITVRKSGGSLNGKRIKIPYHVNDGFKLLIIQLSNSDYDFCIIPIEKLKEIGCISGDNKVGTGICYISPVDYGKPHWSIIYWNNLEKIL